MRVHIERLVLDGLPVARRDAGTVKAALEGELTALFAAGGETALLASGRTPQMTGTALQLTGNETAAALGRQIARAVYGGSPK